VEEINVITEQILLQLCLLVGHVVIHTHTHKCNSDLTDSYLRSGDCESGRPHAALFEQRPNCTCSSRHCNRQHHYSLRFSAYSTPSLLLSVCSHLHVLKQLTNFHEITYNIPQSGIAECITAGNNLALISVCGIVSCSVTATVQQ